MFQENKGSCISYSPELRDRGFTYAKCPDLQFVCMECLTTVSTLLSSSYLLDEHDQNIELILSILCWTQKLSNFCKGQVVNILGFVDQKVCRNYSTLPSYSKISIRQYIKRMGMAMFQQDFIFKRRQQPGFGLQVLLC